MRVFIQSKSGSYNAIITSRVDLGKTLKSLRRNGYYPTRKDTLVVLVPFEEIECIREVVEGDLE